LSNGGSKVRKWFCYLICGLLLIGISLARSVQAENIKAPSQTPLDTEGIVAESPPASPTVAPSMPQESKKARLTADAVRYIDEQRQIEANGHVTVTYNDIIVAADYVLIDQEMNAMLAKGNVQLTKDGTSYTSERLLYYFKTEQGWIAPITSKITSKDESNVKEPIKVAADEAFLDGEELLVNKSYVTGCDREYPHYHFTADSLEYEPDQRIVLHNVWYWEGRVRLFYFPKITISLETEKGGHNDFEMPEIGYSDDKGWYLAWGYNYYFNKKNSARFYLDELTQWGGDGIGVTHYYNPKSTSQWTQDYFYKENSNMGYPKDDYRLKYTYKNTANAKLSYETLLSYYQTYSETGYSELENTYYFYLYGKTPWPNLKFYFHDLDNHTTSSGVTTKETYRTMRFSESWSYNFGKSLALSTSANWNATGYLSAAELTQQFLYSGTLTKTWTNSNLKLYYNDAQVLSGDYSSTNYLPELTYTLSKLQLPFLKELEAVFQYTSLERIDVDDGKISSVESGERWAANLTKTNKLWQSNQEKVSLNVTSLFRYRYFELDEGSDMAGLTESLNLTYKFNKHLSTTTGVGYTERGGSDKDDFFDKGDDFLPGGSLTNSWTWSSPKLSATLSSGYSFYTYEPQTVYLTTTWKPTDANQIYLSTNYDWDDGVGLTYLKLQFNPKKDWKLNINLGYNPQTSYWTTKEFQAYITQRLTKNWKMELAATYDVFDNDFGVANIGLSYDWHCRDVKFYYDYLEKEYWVLISFKAFPQASFKLSSDPDDLYSWYTNYDSD
jgi:lipopolysaccharide assembly outer membrane protein LptD (OstA)